MSKSEPSNPTRLDSISHAASVMEPQALVTKLTNAYVRCAHVGLMKDPCVPSLIKGPFIPIATQSGLARCLILKIKKRTNAF